MELFLLWDILFYFNDNLFILGEKEKRKREIIEKIEDGKKERVKIVMKKDEYK